MRKNSICFRRTNPGCLGHRVLWDRVRRFIPDVSLPRFFFRRRSVVAARSSFSRIDGQGLLPRQ